MALRRVFYSLSLSTTALTHAGFYTLILINSNISYPILNKLSKYAYFHAKWTQKWKSGWGFAPAPTGGAYSAPPDPLAVMGGARPLQYPPPLVNIVIRPPPSRNPGSAAAYQPLEPYQLDQHTCYYTQLSFSCVHHSSIRDMYWVANLYWNPILFWWGHVIKYPYSCRNSNFR